MRRLMSLFCLAAVCCSAPLTAAESDDGYGLNPGDILQVSVWREPELSREVLVRPDGKINFPLVGDIDVADRTPEDVQVELIERLERFIPDAVATVAVLNVAGNKIYILGKVARPGEFPVTGQVDVMQALAMAGGLNQFAAGNKIKILRRDQNNVQRAIEFRYGDVEDGRSLQSNIMLESGDVVVVP
ncbi:MAG: polysaccharide export protein [Gammaproteobacteria bacterium]|nr:polysaccharide export protein [Gammaproteobacteria bacterium]